jgi:hypothetical protein
MGFRPRHREFLRDDQVDIPIAFVAERVAISDLAVTRVAGSRLYRFRIGEELNSAFIIGYSLEISCLLR